MSKPNEYTNRNGEGQFGQLSSANLVETTTEVSTSFTTPASKVASVRQAHQNLVFSDPVAFRYLEEDPATIVLERRRRLQGYEIYLVEQWACSRIHPTFIIATYTGNASHSILVGVLSVPTDEHAWSKRLRIYFQAISQYHARKKETPLGTLMITNLSGFPSALTVVAVPDGDVKKHREDFIVNENLKRLGCSGRAGLNLQPPQPSTVAKYHHLYRTSEVVPTYTSVMELVKVCQVGLTIYGKLLPAYADGLLCDVTEKAINDWWSDIGTEIYNIEPNDGILGPTTVAALIGMLLGAYNRLKVAGAPVGKDVLDTSSTKRAIGAFQKAQKMEPTRRLDRQTLGRLHSVTAKTASGEGWTAAKAVKSTVADLSGKGGEMVMGLVGAREKVGIAEVETLDMDRLAQLVAGPRLKWLWQGKPIKTNISDLFGGLSDDLNGRVFSTDDRGNYMWTSNKRDSVWDKNLTRKTDFIYDQAVHANEEKSGFGRLRDAVGMRSHHPKSPKDGSLLEPPSRQEMHGRAREWTNSSDYRDHTMIFGPETLPRFTDKPAFDLALADSKNMASQVSLQSASPQTTKEVRSGSDAQRSDSRRRSQASQMGKIRRELENDAYYQESFAYRGPKSTYLRRSQSAVKFMELSLDDPRSYKYPRHLSFSAVESAVLAFKEVSVEPSDKADGHQTASMALAIEEAMAVLAQRRAKDISYLERFASRRAESRIDAIASLDQDARAQYEELNNMYYQRLEDYQTLRAQSAELLSEEKTALTEGLRRVEVLGAKLDYELNALQSRIEEVEDGLGDFERNVTDIEARVHKLAEEDGGRVSWYYYITRFFGSEGWS